MPTLHWLTRETDLKLSGLAPYRLLEAVDEHAHGDPATGNMLIQGDNLDALKALLPYYAGAVKCIFIDPPYNTKSAFEHYDDNLEHTKWLSLMYPRLELLRELMTEDGSIWITIDDNEGHYLKVILDEIFGRDSFIAEVSWRNSDNSNNNVTKFSQDHNVIQIYAHCRDWTPNFLNDPAKRKHFKNPNNDPRGPWFDGNPVNNPALRPTLQFDLVSPLGHTIKHPPNGWRWSKETIEGKLSTGELRYSDDGKRLIRRTYLEDMLGLPPSTLWTDLEDTGHTRQAKYELKSLFPQIRVADLFTTPKPEKLIKKILDLATNPGDLVLDSFLGSGTTAAVAHKMDRRYIGIEMGEHAVTHCAPRLRKVIDGEQGGISKAVNWQGGGGFRFYRLGEPIFNDDGSIRQGITFAQLGAHVWFSETKTPLTNAPDSPLLGIREGTAYYLLYNGILKDKSVGGGNVLTARILEGLPAHDGPKVIYGERCLFGESRLKEKRITFKHTPYDIKGR
ncbi:MAG: site-specific DNA-methyltransferase [Pseudomonadota bacterium]